MSSPDPVAVRATFTSVAPRYDLANHLLSGGIDFWWRERLVRMAKKGRCQKILDLATGSGDVAMALRRALPAETEITGVDFCEPILEFAKRKRDRKKLKVENNQFLVGDCLALSFQDNSFDLVTIAFGLRNLADRKKGLAEMRRVLKPGGRLLILEFSQPFTWFMPIYYFYLKVILPWVARLVTGDRDAYLYLGSSISAFPNRNELCAEITGAGFREAHANPLTFSVVALHEGINPD